MTEEEKDREVEAALFQRACGYEAEDMVTEENEKGAKQRTTRYHIPGDVRAMIFWLRNRQPDVWKDRPESDAPREEKGVSIIDDIA